MRAALTWFFFAFLVRFTATLAFHVYSLGAGFEGFYPLASGADDRFYYWAAISLAEGGSLEDLPNFYPIFLSWIFAVFGPSLLLGKLINALLGSLAVYYGVLLARELTLHKCKGARLFCPSNLAGALLTFYPSLLFYSTQLLKDPMVVFLGIVLLFWTVKLLRCPGVRGMILMLFALYVLYLFRGYAVVAYFLSLALFFSFRFGFWRRPGQMAIVFALLVAAPLAFGWGPLGLGYLLPFLEAERLSQLREETYSIGGSSAGISLDFSNPLRFAITYTVSYLTAFLGPLPWQVRSFVVAVGLVDTVPMWLLLGLTFLRCSRARAIDYRAGLILLFALVYLGGIALFSDNIGANTRLRLLPWSALLIYLALRLGRGGSGAPSLPRHPR